MPSRHGDVCLNDPIDRSIDLSSSEVEIDMSEISTRGLPQLVLPEDKDMVVWSEEVRLPSERAMVPENVQFQLRRRRVVRDFCLEHGHGL